MIKYAEKMDFGCVPSESREVQAETRSCWLKELRSECTPGIWEVENWILCFL